MWDDTDCLLLANKPQQIVEKPICCVIQPQSQLMRVCVKKRERLEKRARLWGSLCYLSFTVCCSVPEDNGSDFIATARCSCCRITPDSCKRPYNNLNLRWDIFFLHVSLTELATTKLKQNQGHNPICISEANSTPEMCVNLHFQHASFLLWILWIHS